MTDAQCFVVLVVEDNPDLRDTLVEMIGEELGHHVLSASDADEALGIIDSGVHVDLVFSDVIMPGKDGLILAHEVRRRIAGMPVILTTGFPDVVDSVISRGALALLKPFSLERLEAVLNEQLRSPFCPEALPTSLAIIPLPADDKDSARH